MADAPKRKMTGRLGFGQGPMPSVLSVLLSLLVCFLIIAITRSDFRLAGRRSVFSLLIALTQIDFRVAAEAYAQMLFGGIGDIPGYLETGGIGLLTRPWGESATKAGILLLTGLSVSVAFAAGLFNIGAQGQMTVGALCAAVLGAKLGLPWGLHPLVCILGAAVAGGLYALIPALLKLERGVHEVISTIMLNWVAVSLVENWLVVGPLRAASVGTLSVAGTDQIAATAVLPRLLGELSRLHAGFPLALLIAFGMWLWLSRTRYGFETRAIGLGAEAARAAGIPIRRRTYQAMGLAGALAGVAGALLVLGTEYKYPSVLGAPYGFDGIAISLIGQNHPLGVAVTATVFGVLR
ncbi:MAG TPA: ABC transporter permease, partial [Longimicrobium sp.]|nr:ABC transporter permease [Longimicrobium sp.]